MLDVLAHALKYHSELFELLARSYSIFALKMRILHGYDTQKLPAVSVLQAVPKKQCFPWKMQSKKNQLAASPDPESRALRDGRWV